MTRPDINSIRAITDAGKFPAFAWPGGYPILYLIDGETVCSTCADTVAREAGDAAEIDGWFIHYEGALITCADCNDDMESAYGDPEVTDAGKCEDCPMTDQEKIDTLANALRTVRLDLENNGELLLTDGVRIRLMEDALEACGEPVEWPEDEGEDS